MAHRKDYVTVRDGTLKVGVDVAIDPEKHRPNRTGRWELVSVAIAGTEVIFWWRRKVRSAHAD